MQATDQLSASLVASCLASPAGMSATLADLRAIVARTEEQMAALRKRRSRPHTAIAFLAERKRRCERAVGGDDRSRSGTRARFHGDHGRDWRVSI